MRYAKQFESLGLGSPPGVLLAGPPGCGKTLLAKVSEWGGGGGGREGGGIVHSNSCV